MSRYLDPKADYRDQVSREKTLIMDKYAEGEAKGIERIAINMLKANKSLDEISLFTGLSEDAIARLKTKL